MFSLVIPVYRNEESLPELLTEIENLSQKMNGDFEAVFVIDGSPDRSYEILRNELQNWSFKSQLILLSRNFGSFPAIRAGLKVANGNNFGVMAADLQEPPELILKMKAELEKQDVDIVIATREDREDPFLTRLPAMIFWGFYRRYVIRDIPSGGVDIFACNLQFRDNLLLLEEHHSSLIAQIFWLGFRRRTIGYTRIVRKHGKSAWTLRKKINYLMDSIFSFTDLPVRLLIRIGGTVTFLSAVLAVIILLLRLTGLISVPGYAATIIAIIFFGSANLFALGIVGSYAWRTYENTKARPLHVVLQQHSFNKEV